MSETPADQIRALEEEYRERRQDVPKTNGDVSTVDSPPTKPGLGHIWFDSSTNQLWVCTGRINGKLKWSKIPERLYD